MLRNFITPNDRYVLEAGLYSLLIPPRVLMINSVQKERQYKFVRGTTAWRSESIRNLIVDEKVTLIGGDPQGIAAEGDAMDTT